MSGLPCGPKAALSTKGYFANQHNRFRHIRHLTPRPPAYRYPYPSFFHVVYTAPGLRCRPEAHKADDYVQAARLVPAAEAHDPSAASGAAGVPRSRWWRMLSYTHPSPTERAGT